jgi:Tol biopolymer transport system component
VLRLASSALPLDAVPSPNGRMFAMRAAGCVTSFFDDHIVVRDLRSGRQWSIGADAVRCHELTTPEWNPDGSKLVFAYGKSTLPASTKPSTSQTCEVPHPNRLVVVSALGSSSSRSWKLIPADSGCSYKAAAFDSRGIAAAEACGGNSYLGRAYLLQLNRNERVVTRVPLRPGWEDGLIARDRHGDALVTENQPANEGYRPYDWVWDFDGHHLRPGAGMNRT